MYVYTPCPRLTRRGYTYSFVIERSEIEQASEKDREREKWRRRKRRRRGRSRVRAGETIFIGSLERVSCPSRLSPQPVCDLRERNVAAAVASLGRRCIGIVGFARGAYVSSRARARERERERERKRARERGAYTAVEAGRPAGRRPISVAGGWLAGCCLCCSHRCVYTIMTLHRRQPLCHSAAALRPAPRKPFSAGNAGTRSAASHRIGETGTFANLHALHAFTPNKHGARRPFIVPYAADASPPRFHDV